LFQLGHRVHSRWVPAHLQGFGQDVPMDRLPAGTWPSPITAASLVAGANSIDQIVADGDHVWWAESRPDEGGRTALMRWSDGNVVEVTPPGTNVRTRVHEYGGGAWWASSGVAYFVDDADQRLRRLSPGSEPTLLSPVPDVPRGCRYADGRVTRDGQWFVCVRESHGRSGIEPINELVAVATDGSLDVRVIAHGADFYASPRISPDGRQVAWIQWMHPNMPWDATELWLADLAITNSSTNSSYSAQGSGRGEIAATLHRRVAGNGDEALQQPEWSGTGDLFVATDRTDWWNVYRVDIATGALTHAAGGAYDVVEPHWGFGDSRFVVGELGCDVHVIADRLCDRLSGHPDLPYTTIQSLRAVGGGVVFVGSSFQRESEVVRFSGGRLDVLRPARQLPFDAAYLPSPEFIEFPSSGGGHAYALFYAPANPGVGLPDGERPPVLVYVHGGPTGAAPRDFNARRAHRFWTSRGIAVVDVDFRGSSRYGRSYRNLLRGQWCVTDVHDAISAVDFLVARGDVEGNRALIRGGSAGGTTALLALATSNRFATGANYYGVTDMVALLGDDHKFEARYAFQLIGPYPERADLYEQRSPINRVHDLSSPLIVFQGADDPVVPPQHSELIVDALHARGQKVAYLSFEGEGHGFRRAESLIRSLEAELWFYGQVLGFEPADTIEPVSLNGRGDSPGTV
jgi:dipeptidyl aminopeptidase/acylaminoacyl peptidase